MSQPSTGSPVGQPALVNYRHKAVVRFWGEVHFAKGEWVGVEFDEENLGDHDGIVQGVRYFQARPKSALFVRPPQVMLFTDGEKAALAVQNASRKLLAKRRALKERSSSVWNKLDNFNEHLAIQRSLRLRGLFGNVPAATKQQAKILDLCALELEPDYNGPVLSEQLSLTNVVETLEAFKEHRLLHAKFAAEIIVQAHALLNAEPNLQEIPIEDGTRLTIVGDLHGQLQDLFSIFTINGIPSPENKYLFNGDFVDRGGNGCEILYSILMFKILYPTAVFLNRGNHESRQQNRVMGFEREVLTKYPGQNGRILLSAFANLFDQLPLAALVHQKIFVVHGGLFRQDGVTFDHIRQLDRRREPPLHSDQFQDQVFEAMLWSDPRPIHGRKLSQRGAGVEFGQEVTFEFLKKNRVALIVRSHECVHEGFELAHSGRLITLFSASYYCGLQTNKGAFLSVGPDLQPEIQQFYAASLAEATWEVPELLQNKRLEDENVKMIIERLVDCKHSLLWQFSICDTEKTGRISRLDWSKSLRLVLELDIPFLLYQNRLAELEPDGTINYSKFLDRYRVELAAGAAEAMDRWQEAVINKICEKMFVALGAGDVNEAFRRFDVDSNGYIEYHEFVSTLRSLNLNLSEQQIYELMAGLDTDRDSRIDPREFASRFEIVYDNMVRSRQAAAKTVTRTLEETLVLIARGLCRAKGSIEGAFRAIDTENKGKITYEQFQEVLWEIPDVKINREQMREITFATDLDNDGYIDYIEFSTAFKFRDTSRETYHKLGTADVQQFGWQEKVLQQIANFFYQNRSELSSLFRSFDANNDGFISMQEFRDGCMKLNSVFSTPITVDDVEAIMRALDENGDGKLSYEEFINGFKVVDTVQPLDDSYRDLPPGGGLSEPFYVAKTQVVAPGADAR